MAILEKMNEHQKFSKDTLALLEVHGEKLTIPEVNVITCAALLRLVDTQAEIVKELEFFNNNLHRVGEGI